MTQRHTRSFRSWVKLIASSLRPNSEHTMTSEYNFVVLFHCPLVMGLLETASRPMIRRESALRCSWMWPSCSSRSCLVGRSSSLTLDRLFLSPPAAKEPLTSAVLARVLEYRRHIHARIGSRAGPHERGMKNKHFTNPSHVVICGP